MYYLLLSIPIFVVAFIAFLPLIGPPAPTWRSFVRRWLGPQWRWS